MASNVSTLLDGDGKVNFGDFSSLASHFNPIGLPPRPSAPSISPTMQRLSEAAVDHVLEEAADDDDDNLFDGSNAADAVLLGVSEEL